MQRTMLYISIFILGFVAISVWNFWIVTHPPQIGIAGTPSDFELPAQDITLTTSDGLRLSAWWIPSEPTPNKAVVLLHGYPVEKGDMLGIARALYPDFSLLLLDLRSFGKSEGTYTTLGVHEVRDVETAIDFLETKDIERIGVFGFSLGGAIALRAAATDERVDAVASYGSLASLRTLGYDTYRTLWLLKYPMVELLLLYARITFGVSPHDESPEKAAGTLSIPTLVIHNRDDEQITFRHAEILQRALAENPYAEFYFPSTGSHNYLPLDFDSRLKNFFTKTL